MAEEYPILQGEAQSWANIMVRATLYDGPQIELADIAAISWENPVERGLQRRTNGQVKARTRGQSSPTAKLSFYADGAQNFIDQLITIASAKGYVDNGEALYGMVNFDIVIQHQMIGESEIRQVELLGCCLGKDMADHSEGTDADKNELELSVVSVVRVVKGKRGRML